MEKEIWILTESVNDYNQYGDYFICAFLHKPSKEELMNIQGHDMYEKDAIHLTEPNKDKGYRCNYHLERVLHGEGRELNY